MMNCSFVRGNLSAFIDGELDRDCCTAIAQHFDQCPACSQECDAFKKIGELARSQVAVDQPLPAWDMIASRLEGSDVHTVYPPGSVIRWKMVAGLVAALAASLLIIANLRVSPPSELNDPSQVSAAGVNLQPVVELFRQNPDAALHVLTENITHENVTIDHANASFGRPTYVSTAANKNALPSGAKIVSTQLLSFSFCNCPPGQCHCGHRGCHCVACVCERPDGSKFLVLEQCNSPDFSFGDLPVQLVNRDGRHLQQITVGGTKTISLKRELGRLTVVGLKSEAEIETLLAIH